MDTHHHPPRRLLFLPAALLLLLLSLLGGCRSVHQLERHTLVRDSVTLARADTLSVVWRYRVDTTVTSDTLRHITEEGEVRGEARTLLRVDSVHTIERDTIIIREAPTTAPRPRRPSATPWLIGGAVLALLLLAAARLLHELRA